MPVETTATILISQLQVTFMDRFHAQDLLMLEENHRTVWILVGIDGDEPRARTVIRPSAPEHLLAAGLLGFLLRTCPDELDEKLRRLVTDKQGIVDVAELSDSMAAAVLAAFGRVASAVVTLMPDSSIATEAAIAGSPAMRIAEVSG